MARPIKQGLTYFPFDVDFFNDEKIEAISGEFGIKGEIVAIKLLTAVYRNGYFIEWSEMLQMKMLKSLPSISKELLDQIISRLIRWEFFDENLFNSAQILTSKGIQKRYFEAMKRNKGREYLPYLLVSVAKTTVNVAETPVNVAETTQKKVKESKVNVLLEKEPKYSEYIGEDDFSKTTESSQQTADSISLNSEQKQKEKSSAKKEKVFTPPTIQEVQDYCTERQNGIDAENFWNFYQSKGWMVGKNKMKDWKACIITWEKSRKKENGITNNRNNNQYASGPAKPSGKTSYRTLVARAVSENSAPNHTGENITIDIEAVQ